MRFKTAALRSKLRPTAFCLTQTAIFELPLSTILVAGWEYCGDRREVIRNNLSLLFFFCTHECSPSTSAAALPRFLESATDHLGKNAKPLSGSGNVLNGIVGCARSSMGIGILKNSVPKPGEGVAGVILRCPDQYVVSKGKSDWANNPACSRRLGKKALVGDECSCGAKCHC